MFHKSSGKLYEDWRDAETSLGARTEAALHLPLSL